VDTLLPALKDLFDSGIDVEEMLNLTDKRAVTAFATIASGVDDVSNLNTELVNAEGTAKEFADVMRDSLKGSLDEASSAANGFVINLLEKLAPAITFIVDGVALLFNGLGLLVNNFGKVALAVGAYGVVMAATAISQGVFTTALGVARLSIVSYIKSTRIATIVTNLFGKAMKTNPIGLFVGALTLGVAALVSFYNAGNDAADATEKLNSASVLSEEANKGLSNSIAASTGELVLLKKSLENSETTEEQRIKLIKEANEQYQGLNLQLDENNNLTDDSVIAIDDQIASLTRLATANAIRGEFEKVEATRVAANIELMKKLTAAGFESVSDYEEQVEKRREIISKRRNESLRANELEFRKAAEKPLTDALAAGSDLIKDYDVIIDGVSKQQSALSKILADSPQLQGGGGGGGDDDDDDDGDIDKVRTAYEKLGDAVKANEDALKRAITTNGNVEKATEDLRKSKEELAVVDDKLKKITDGLTELLEEEDTSLQELTKSTEKNIALERKRLDILNLLSDESGDIATERIKQSLKVAQVELDSALKIAEASDFVTDAQIQNIQKLRGEVVEYQNTLEVEGDVTASGFLQKTLFGTNEDGQPITGEDLLNGIATTLNATSELLGGFNALQNERLNTQLSVIESNSNAEVKAFEESAEFEILTDEERTAKIEQIQEKHDDEMLKLKIAQFKSDQNVQIAQAVIGGATAVMQILKGEATGNVIADAIIKGILIATTVGTTALQIATIKAQAPPTAEFGGVMDDSFFAKGGMVHGNSHAQGGVKFGVGGRVAELEGGEAVINKRSTAMFKPMLSRMNVAGGGKKFADGGMVFGSDSLSDDSGLIDGLVGALNNQQVLLVESDVTNSQRNVKNIQSRITF